MSKIQILSEQCSTEVKIRIFVFPACGDTGWIKMWMFPSWQCNANQDKQKVKIQI